MSTAQLVPETRGLDGDDARQTLRRVGIGQLLVRSVKRFRFSDGFSHARSLGLLIALVLVQALIAVVGFATAFGRGSVAHVIARTIEGIVPGPAGQTLRTSLDQATSAGATHRFTALFVGLVGAIITGATAFGQIERGANRIYGVEKDRPTVKKYGLATLMTLSAGVAATIAFVLLSVGWEVGRAIHNDTVAATWGVLRWPLGVLLLIVVATMVFKWSPRRCQPGLSWMVLGGFVSVGLWVAFSVAMSGFLRWSNSFGDTYGPLAGIVALLLWSFFSGIALFLGLAVTAQLEAERGDRHNPESTAKVVASEPDQQGRVLVRA